MAVNALVIRNGIPVPVSREQFLHMDEGLSIEVGNNNNYKGKGKVYLTNCRLIFLKRDPSRQFSSFCLPYLYIIKYKYNKKLLGGPVISGTVKTIINGGLHGNDETKWSITFNDANTGKAFYNLFEKELNKLHHKDENRDKYKRVINSPSLPIEQIFPDQFAAYKRQQRQKKQSNNNNNNNIVLLKQHSKFNNNNNNDTKQQIVVGQSPDDAPMQLTHDYRAQKAKLFSSKSVSSPNILGPISGASPVNTRAFKQHRVGKTVIQDETNKWNQIDQSNQQQNKNGIAAAPAQPQQYNAYVDPANPEDVVLSVPFNDNQFNDNPFNQDDEGKSNINDNDNGYMYGIAQNYQEKQDKKGVAVNVEIDDDDDFAERPKVQPAGIKSIPPPKSANNKIPKPKRIRNNQNNNNNNNNNIDYNGYDLLSQKSNGSVMSDDTPSPMNGNHKKQGNKELIQDNDNPWADSITNDNNKNTGNVPSGWAQFQE